MRANFFITGLPRSRTAWLANLFTTGEQVCHHDLLGKVSNVEQFRRMLKDGAGVSDASLIWLFPKLREMYPAARWLLVERAATDTINSIRRVAAGTQWEKIVGAYTETAEAWLPQYMELVAAMVKDKRVIRLPYAELDNYDSVWAAWKFLCPTTRLTRERFDFLHPLRVELIPAKQPLALSPQLIEDLKLWRS